MLVMNKQQGFTLFEVLISIFIAGVAVLGLVLLELKILRSSQSSFNYTVATIEANSFVDDVWMNLCNIQGVSRTPGTYATLYSEWDAAMASRNFKAETDSGLTTFVQDDVIKVSWSDPRFSSAEETENNKMALHVSYPNFIGKCT